MEKAKKLIRRLLPYWLRHGDQTCAGCGRHHVHSVAAFCVACDRPHCPICVIVVDGETVCPECHEGET